MNFIVNTKKVNQSNMEQVTTLSSYNSNPHVSRDLVNYNDILEQMKGDKNSTIVCLKMMVWLIKDIEISTGENLETYKNIWENAFNISLKNRKARKAKK